MATSSRGLHPIQMLREWLSSDGAVTLTRPAAESALAPLVVSAILSVALVLGTLADGRPLEAPSTKSVIDTLILLAAFTLAFEFRRLFGRHRLAPIPQHATVTSARFRPTRGIGALAIVAMFMLGYMLTGANNPVVFGINFAYGAAETAMILRMRLLERQLHTGLYIDRWSRSRQLYQASDVLAQVDPAT